MTRRAKTLPPFHVFAAEVLGRDPATRVGHVVIDKALDGLPLDDAELAMFQTYTGRAHPREGGYPRGLVLTGRQSGKTERAADRVTFEAVRAALAGMRDCAVVGIAQDHRASQRALFAYIQRNFEQPMLRELVIAQTADSITLRGNVRILVLPCRPAAIRGLRCVIVVLDEICHYLSTDQRPLDREAWRASLPTVLMTRGKVLALSSPYIASGLAYDLHAKYYGVDCDTLVWQSPGVVLNPTLSAEALAAIRDVDPEGAEAELEAQFLRHVSALLDDDTIRAAVDAGVVVRKARGAHVVAVDVATGSSSGGDNWATAVAHREGDTVVLDAVEVVRPPFSPETCARQTVQLCAQYGVRTVIGDRFAVGFTGEAFARVSGERVKWQASEQSTSDNYLTFASLLSSGRVRLLDRPDLLTELRGLERRRGATKDRVDHRRGLHDDAAAATASACVAAMARGFGPSIAVIMPSGDPSWRQAAWRR